MTRIKRQEDTDKSDFLQTSSSTTGLPNKEIKQIINQGKKIACFSTKCILFDRKTTYKAYL